MFYTLTLQKYLEDNSLYATTKAGTKLFFGSEIHYPAHTFQLVKDYNNRRKRTNL